MLFEKFLLSKKKKQYKKELVKHVLLNKLKITVFGYNNNNNNKVSTNS